MESEHPEAKRAGHRLPCVVVIGVSGVGKSTVSRILAQRLDIPFAEADDFHPPANIAKMSTGVPLDDADRESWLDSIGRWLHERDVAGTGGVVACSALRRRYRDVLRTTCPTAFFVHLTAGHDLLERRLSERADHFMPTALLDSQEATLEPLEPDERGGSVETGPTPDAVAEMALELLPNR